MREECVRGGDGGLVCGGGGDGARNLRACEWMVLRVVLGWMVLGWMVLRVVTW